MTHEQAPAWRDPGGRHRDGPGAFPSEQHLPRALANEVNIVSHVETEKKVLGTRQSVPNHQARRSLRQKPLVALGLGDGGPTGADGW